MIRIDSLMNIVSFLISACLESFTPHLIEFLMNLHIKIKMICILINLS